MKSEGIDSEYNKRRVRLASATWAWFFNNLGGWTRQSDNADMVGSPANFTSRTGSEITSEFSSEAMRAEKRTVATNSLLAAVAITGLKIVVGITTGSLGIISEAAHSGLDLIAAAVTLFSVHVSDKPADADHQYGHGKVENFSAFIETGLLLLTCVLIVYEASKRLFVHHVEIDPSVAAFMVMFFSMALDFWRSRALGKIAVKYDSQALQADALHFSTDIWSSAVVVMGLVLVMLGRKLHIACFTSRG